MQEILAHFKFSQDSQNLILSLFILFIFIIIFVLFYFYYRYTQMREKFELFYFSIADRGISKSEAKKLFTYFKKHDIDPKMLLESEEIMEKAIKYAEFDLEEMRKKLGFDKKSLIENYLKHQEELRKKWNRK